MRVWQLVFDKAPPLEAPGGQGGPGGGGGFARSSFQRVAHALTVSAPKEGHRASVLSFAFANDSSMMATVSKDATWKLWLCTLLFYNLHILIHLLRYPLESHTSPGYTFSHRLHLHAHD